MILVTGATGFVGRRLIPALRQRFPTKPIRILARTLPAPDTFPEGIQVFLGDLEDTEVATAVVRDTEVVIHLAAKVLPHAREIGEMRRANTEAARNLYSAAVAAGAKLFVHMSSAGVYGPPRSAAPFTEDDACNPTTAYQISKFEAEEALRKMEPGQTTLNILRPTGIYGSGSFDVSAYKKVLGQRWTAELSGGVIVHPTHVTDVVEGITALVEQPASTGTIFNLGGERPLLLQDLFALMAHMLGCHRRRIVLSRSIVGPLSQIAESVCSMIGRPKPLLAAMCQGYCFSTAVDDRRFREQYPGALLLSLTDGLREHIDWARANCLLGGAPATKR
jgi:nucleoside-diphosphate-sugar epimerase